ncbi:MAG: hypothetical protein LBM08_13745 [Dysgonamonadaceae bacterium]|jgi:hypothetical protein|nr:hypothetical protein [Dysgonamonadaceae bacterium]
MKQMSKFMIYSMLMFCILPSCGHASDAINELAALRYDKKHNTLLIRTFESAQYISKIDLNLKQDTLFVGKISRRLILFKKTEIVPSTAWSIKLQSNVGFVKFNGALLKLSEIEEYSLDELIENSYSVIIVSPEKFPCVLR